LIREEYTRGPEYTYGNCNNPEIMTAVASQFFRSDCAELELFYVMPSFICTTICT